MIIEPAHKLDFIQEYYFSGKLREIAQMMSNGKPVINLGIGNPDQVPAEQVTEVLQRSVAQSGNHGYQSYIGIPQLRHAMAEFYKRFYEIELNPDNEILPLLGSKEGISHIHQAFLNPGDKVLIPNPGYPTYTSAARLAGAVPVYYDLDENRDWAPDWSSVSEEDLHEAKIIWVNYPHMPTGASGSEEIFRDIIDKAMKHQWLVVNDNPYSMVLNKKKPLSILKLKGAKECALELNSLSKSFNLAGMRVGMVIGGSDYISTILKVKSNMDSGMYKPLQEAAITALSASDEWHTKRNAVYASRLKTAKEIMEVLECTFKANQTGMFLWARIPEKYTDVEDLTEKLLHEAHVFITPGFIFGSKGKRYIRISLCSKEEILNEALLRIKNLSL